MLVSVIPIGNSFGIKIPDAVMKRLNIHDTVDIEVQDRNILMKPVDCLEETSPERVYTELPENDWQ